MRPTFQKEEDGGKNGTVDPPRRVWILALLLRRLMLQTITSLVLLLSFPPLHHFRLCFVLFDTGSGVVRRRWVQGEGTRECHENVQDRWYWVDYGSFTTAITRGHVIKSVPGNGYNKLCCTRFLPE